MELPNNARKLARSLFEDTASQQNFLSSLEAANSERKVQIATNGICTDQNLAEWAPDFVIEHEGKSPGNQNYQLDLSSVFACAPLNQIENDYEFNVLDVCSAPGGKAVFTSVALSPKTLICNEVIGKRIKMLTSNLERCNIRNVSVINNDSKILAENFNGVFDLVLVDAPCSGQSLIAKGEKALSCFHPATINQNSNRQRRIIANSIKCVAPSGYLLYSTCTFSIKENEKVLEWAMKTFPELSTVEVPVLAKHHSTYSDLHCYRLWPQDGYGAGAFTALLKNNSEGQSRPLESEKLRSVWASKTQ